MYEELVKELRNRRICIQQSGNLEDFPLLRKAADAIEELSKREADMSHNMAALSLKVLRAEERAPRWISVEEALPVCGDVVLCVGDNGTSIADFVIGDKWSALPWFFVDGEQETGITHWMPLPEPPKEEET